MPNAANKVAVVGLSVGSLPGGTILNATACLLAEFVQEAEGVGVAVVGVVDERGEFDCGFKAWLLVAVLGVGLDAVQGAERGDEPQAVHCVGPFEDPGRWHVGRRLCFAHVLAQVLARFALSADVPDVHDA